jgi:hypothetical protein
MIRSSKEASRQRMLAALARQLMTSENIRTVQQHVQNSLLRRDSTTSEKTDYLLRLYHEKKAGIAPLCQKSTSESTTETSESLQLRQLWYARNTFDNFERFHNFATTDATTDAAASEALDRQILKMVDRHNNKLLGSTKDNVNRLYIDRFSFDPRRFADLERFSIAKNKQR